MSSLKESELYYINYYKSSYSNLPMEIIIKIFEYLNPVDLLNVNLVCHRWHEAATQHPKLTLKLQLRFENVYLDDSTPPIRRFLREPANYESEVDPEFPVLQPRTFRNILINQVDCGKITACLSKFGEYVQVLTLRNCDIREKAFIAILSKLENLNELTIENCRELFMPGRLLDDLEYQKMVTKSFSNIKICNLTSSRYLSDAIFHRLTQLLPNIISLNLSGCHISFHIGLYKRFYPNNNNQLVTPSENVLTFNYVIQFVRLLAAKIQYINFSKTLIDGSALVQLAAIDELQLKTLILRDCDQLTNPGIIVFIQCQQNTLQHLDLSKSVRLTDASLIEICGSLQQLKVLKIRRCRAVTDLGVREIQHLKRLEILDISECEAITQRSIISGGIAQTKNEQLKELYLSALNICENCIINIAENFANLLILDISYCKIGVTDLAIQLIFKYLVKLRTLNLEYCDMISDAGITGMNMMKSVQFHESSNEPKSPPSDSAHDEIIQNIIEHDQPQQDQVHLDDNANDNEANKREEPLRRIVNNNDENAGEPYRISLRSKAETDIVMDARRKKLILDMYEKNAMLMNSPNIYDDEGAGTSGGSNNNNDNFGYSINRLKGLRHLNLTACNKITDVSLKYGFRFTELQSLNLSKCQQISMFGIDTLILTCPSIEKLNLSDCHNVNDKTIELITKKLKRLTHLYLKRCILLTDHTLDYIAVNCKIIKELDVDGCRSMSSNPQSHLMYVSSLHYNLMLDYHRDECYGNANDEAVLDEHNLSLKAHLKLNLQKRGGFFKK